MDFNKDAAAQACNTPTHMTAHACTLVVLALLCAAATGDFTDQSRYAYDNKCTHMYTILPVNDVLSGTILSKIVPFWYGPKPALLQMGGSTDYSYIMTAVRRDGQLAAVLCSLGVLYVALKASHLL